MKKLFVVACGLVATACSMSPSENSTVKSDDMWKPVSMKLYTERNVTPSDFCDRHTYMEMTKSDAGYQANVEYALAGTCELAVIPDARSYQLVERAVSSCGERTFDGKTADGGREITIVDNRYSVCDNVIPALFVVQEKTNGANVTLFSHDASILEIDPVGDLEMFCTQDDTEATPYLSFLLRKKATDETASITYVKSAFFGSEEFHFEQPVPGCEAENSSFFRMENGSLYAECAADGDAGYMALDRQSDDSWKGSMVFPNTGVEGYDDTSISVTCSIR